MNRVFKSEFFNYAIYILGAMALVKLVWFIVAMLFLPSTTKELESKGDLKPLYYRLYLAKATADPIKIKPKTKKPMSTSTGATIRSLSLLGIYRSSDLIVVTVKKGSKTKVLSRGEEIAGFVLVNATRDQAFFEKNGKSYTLNFKKQKSTSSSKAMVRDVKKVSTTSKPKADVVESGGVKIVKRDMLEGYMKKPKDIWKDIGISEIKKGKEITGFRVRFVRKESGFEKLGIKRGDIILAINGERLDSYQGAFKAYKEINNIENLTLTIKRKNQEMELDYEIK